MPTKTCFNCGFASLNSQQCLVIGTPIDPAAHYSCPYWVKELIKCYNCGQIIPNKNHTISQTPEGKWKSICDKCLQLSGTCGGCVNSQSCDFETNPSPIPKAVQKRIQQGNQIMVVTVKSDERINETCVKNCECFDQDNRVCLKENGTCGKYKGAF